ncbi:MAG: hypothetical protein ABIP77_06745 [Candidatus Limnocylindrales bacterium]
MSAFHHHRRQGHGSAVVRAWVRAYTLGLPEPMRSRRRDEVAGDLAEEAMDAVRRGRARQLFQQRILRLLSGVPSDVAWRLVDAPTMARAFAMPTAWIPLTRWSTPLLATAAIGSGGALWIVSVPYLTGQAPADVWPGWGLYGFTIGCAAVLAGIIVSAIWPSRGARLVVPGAILGMLASPWLWGCWILALIAVGVRGHQERHVRDEDQG